MKNYKLYTHKDYLNEYNVCELCGRSRPLQLHHVVPLCAGGPDIIENWIAICEPCHNRLTPKGILTKLGLERCKRNGIKLGGKKGIKLKTKKEVLSKPEILKYSKDFNGSMNDAELIKKLNIARNTFYRYKKEIKETLTK